MRSAILGFWISAFSRVSGFGFEGCRHPPQAGVRARKHTPKGESFDPLKIVLVLLALLVKVCPTMKRIFALIVLLGIVMSAVLTGCNNEGDKTSAPADTNAPAASTNK
jgi:hypothetical protein